MGDGAPRGNVVCVPYSQSWMPWHMALPIATLAAARPLSASWRLYWLYSRSPATVARSRRRSDCGGACQEKLRAILSRVHPDKFPAFGAELGQHGLDV